MIFGAHCSTAGGLYMALRRAREITGDICQLFVKNNMQWLGKPYAQADVDTFWAERKASKLAAVFGHAGYLINLGAAPSANRDKSIQSLIQELTFAQVLGLPFLVLHPGAHLGAGEEKGIAQTIAGLDEVFRATQAFETAKRIYKPVRIALENTAGQGSCFGCQIEHLAAIFDRVQSPERLAVCLDTAHLLASGYNIRTPGGWNSVIGRVDSLIGLKQVVAFHLNDSKTDLGSRVDRHEHIGKGKIGSDAFRHIVSDARFGKTPGCLETPRSKDLHEDVENLKVLRSLIDG